ncbi:tRNA (5-methylaminomethyl-2-thiouridine)(34)-methyltransferase MnmD [Chitinophaga ginsengisoli]|uniref:tRNA U34 5-methylaminomethyl-2-thiouridine-forming methyltransferase MnmC n=1 Tax=Chitinophaga ginsengisoli TaxID=363837 RepID=A0A2P8GE28_9BACT|nr:tRNA (5-methylaminomethyl-2-thiouridine)(34)-methyltransferase MnmD [Chitinophaga ginsengisoli]PSL32238.1 tRNA U34 5-methylaminomethyl-2-thiouridine-forming methyltransferase MnmC [Chitinophaga ginsengisoli]
MHTPFAGNSKIPTFVLMERTIQVTADGSHTVSVPAWNVTYHSIHGAIRESVHVFIDAGLKYQQSKKPADTLSILEMGFGTGLNALLTFREAVRERKNLYYQTIEQYPLTWKEVGPLNYADQLNEPILQSVLTTLHSVPWNTDVQINPYYCLHKTHAALQDVSFTRSFDIIYYDAFAPTAQPELWTEDIFEKLYHCLTPGGILVTYCSKGNVRRAMKAVGFIVEKKVPGPPRKREMLRAIRPDTI